MIVLTRIVGELKCCVSKATTPQKDNQKNLEDIFETLQVLYRSDHELDELPAHEDCQQDDEENPEGHVVAVRTPYNPVGKFLSGIEVGKAGGRSHIEGGSSIVGKDVAGEDGHHQEDEGDVDVVEEGDSRPLECEEAGDDRVIEVDSMIRRLGHG